MEEMLYNVPGNQNGRCPFCEKEISSFAGPRMPRAGDPGLCAYCYAVYIYNADLSCRRPTFKEHQHLQANSDFQAAIKNAVAVLKQFKKR